MARWFRPAARDRRRSSSRSTRTSASRTPRRREFRSPAAAIARSPSTSCSCTASSRRPRCGSGSAQRTSGGLPKCCPCTRVACLPGVVPLLENACGRAATRRLGLITGNVAQAAQHKLRHYELWDWFPFGGFGDEHADRCDIAAAALAAGRTHLNGLAHRELVVIGDTPNDVRCARSIGARAWRCRQATPRSMSCGQRSRTCSSKRSKTSSRSCKLFDAIES